MSRPQLSVTPPPPESDGKKLWETAAEAQAVDPSWLLPGRIVGNGLCIVEGDSNVGKSTFLCHLAASVTTGRKWMGRKKCAPADVLWLSGEESPASMIRPRLLAAGADLDRVHWPAADDTGVVRPLYLPMAVHQLRDAIDLYGLSMIVIEPLVSFVAPELSLNQEGPARSVVDPLNRLCMQTGCTIIVTRGLRKDRSGPRLTHGSGHGTIGQTARSVLVIDQPDPEQERRILRAIKNMSGTRTPPLEYTLDRSGGAPRMVGLTDLVGADDDAVGDQVDPGERSIRADAREMLRTICATEYVAVTIIQAAAEASGLGWRTVVRVKAELRIHSRPNRQMTQFFHEWGPPLGGWTAPTPPVRSTPCALPRTRKSRKKTTENE
jgi:putative DNA primase/helicase